MDPDAATSDPEATLRAQAVEILTRAVRCTRTLHDGTVEPADFADFLASVLAAVAANVGYVERLTRGRPGSWEAALVDQLVLGTVGYEPDTLLAYRTEPVRIPLNVAQLVEELGFTVDPPVVTFEQAVEAAVHWPDRDELTDEEWDDVERTNQDIEDKLARRYREAYIAYAERFAAMVTAEARARLRSDVPVEVMAETDPSYASRGSIRNPDGWDIMIGATDDDPLVWELWEETQQQLGLPRP